MYVLAKNALYNKRNLDDICLPRNIMLNQNNCVSLCPVEPLYVPCGLPSVTALNDTR